MKSYPYVQKITSLTCAYAENQNMPKKPDLTAFDPPKINFLSRKSKIDDFFHKLDNIPSILITNTWGVTWVPGSNNSLTQKRLVTKSLKHRGGGTLPCAPN